MTTPTTSVNTKTSAKASEKTQSVKAADAANASANTAAQKASGKAQEDTSFCMIESVRNYLGRDGKVVTQEVLRLVRAADVKTDAVPRMRSGRNRQTPEGSVRRNIRFPVDMHEKFKQLGGSSWLRVAVEKEMAAASGSKKTERKSGKNVA